VPIAPRPRRLAVGAAVQPRFTASRPSRTLLLAGALLLAAAAIAQERAPRDEGRIVAAMRDRNLAEVRTLLAEGFPANAQDRETASALHWAAHWNDVDAVKLLLEAGADPNVANRFGVTPMHEAAIVNNAEIIELMLAAGGDPNAAFGKGETVLMTAARTGNARAVRALLAAGGDPNAAEGWHGQTALMWAALENHADVVQVLLEAGAEIDRPSTAHDWIEISYSEGNVPKMRDVGGLTALQFAARNGSTDAVLALLDAGANAAYEEPMHRLTTLQLAIVNGHWALAKQLIDRGVGVDDGSLYLAVDTRNLGYFAQRPNPPERDGDVSNLDVIDALLARGANPDLPYTKSIPERTVAGTIAIPEGATPLDRAAAAGDFVVVEKLVAKGANPNVAAADGTTPLMLLAGHRRGRGAPPEYANDPARLAAIRTLLERGAEPNAVHGQTGNTPLHFAATRGAADIIALLKEFGADETLRNKAGQVPADLLPTS